MRSAFAVVLILLAAILTPLAAVAVWTSDEIGDTDRYVATMAPLASDPDIQAGVTNRVTDAVMEHVDVNSLLAEVAPADRPRLDQLISRLGKPLSSGLTSFVHSTVERFVASDAFATIWTGLNRAAHTAVDKALTSDNGNKVTIDLAPVIDKVKERLVGDGLNIASKIPEVHTSYTVVDSDAIGKARTGFRLLKIAGVWLPVITLLFAAAGVLLAVRRRRALVTAALLVGGGALALGLGLVIFRSLYLDKLPDTVSQPAAAAVFDTLVGFLRTSVRMVAVLGAVVALGAWLTGSGRWAARAREMWTGGIGAVRGAAHLDTGAAGRWVHAQRTWLNWGVVAVAVVVFLLWSHPTGVVVLVIALCTLVALALVEFLAADPADPTDPSDSSDSSDPAAPATAPADS
ncbi:hypothetical protein J0695_09645 [Streptomyces beijiangensis]|uniref:Integral membrane protein n=2 Tax=Streptomyces beijiangensis TaxID=163361 RepID=A0A939F4S7_9ACTN|nr:hypothetical protein [Streptomyces beijiangensis]